MNRNPQGFTLIELLVVVAIIGILAAVAIPSYNSYVARARQEVAFVSLHKVRMAMENYRAKNGFYPSMGDLGGAITNLPGIENSFMNDVDPQHRYTLTIESATQDTYILQADCSGACNIDDDATADTWQMNELGEITVVVNDVTS